MPNRRHDVNETADAREERERVIEERAQALATKVAARAKGNWRRDLIGVASLFAFILLAATFLIQMNSINSARATCERANDSRVASFRLYSDLVTVNQRRIDAAKEVGDKTTLEAQRFAKRQYQKDLDAYVKAQEDAAFEPGVESPMGVIADCARVNPYPFPLG